LSPDVIVDRCHASLFCWEGSGREDEMRTRKEGGKEGGEGR
jgi:hypothetical protein